MTGATAGSIAIPEYRCHVLWQRGHNMEKKDLMVISKCKDLSQFCDIDYSALPLSVASIQLL